MIGMLEYLETPLGRTNTLKASPTSKRVDDLSRPASGED